MERFFHPQQIAAIDALPKYIRGVTVKEGPPINGDPYTIEGYTFDRVLNNLLYIVPSPEALAANHVMRLTTKPSLSRGVEIFNYLKEELRDGYDNLPTAPVTIPLNSVNKTTKLENLIVLPSTETIRKGLVDFSIVDEVIKRRSHGFVKPHPNTSDDILEELEQRYPKRLLAKDSMLYLYVRSFSRIFITSQSEAGISAIFHGKPYELIDNPQCQSVIPSLRSLYRGIASSPTRTSFKDKLIRCLSYPESGLIATGTGHEEEDIKRFFTQYTLHNHAS